ncbi:hypothetical protein D9M72_243330 [compost metagenome]
MDVGRHRRRDHHAGQVIVAEHQRTLVRAGGQNHPSCADLPQQLARALALRCRQVVGETLCHGHEIVVLISEGGAARKDRHVRQLAQFGRDLLGPLQRGLAIELGATGKQAAAKLALIVDQDHARTGYCRRMRCPEARRAAANHQHVAVRVALVVAIGVAHVGRLAKTGRVADLLFVLRPHLARPHEGLVVEAGGHEARKLLVDRHAIAFEIGLRIHAGRDEPVIELDFRRARVRHRIRAAFELHHGIRLSDVRRHDATRAVILEAARDKAHAVGEQRRRERVALEPLIRASVEREGQRNRAIDAATGAETVFLAHFLPPTCGASCGALAPGWPKVS